MIDIKRTPIWNNEFAFAIRTVDSEQLSPEFHAGTTEVL